VLYVRTFCIGRENNTFRFPFSRLIGSLGILFKLNLFLFYFLNGINPNVGLL
jgi:hypothetical protein